MGRTFGVVTSGFSIGGMVGPLMFGFIMDHGAPRWVFGASVIVMIVVAVVALFGDRRSARRRALDGRGGIASALRVGERRQPVALPSVGGRNWPGSSQRSNAALSAGHSPSVIENQAVSRLWPLTTSACRKMPSKRKP